MPFSARALKKKNFFDVDVVVNNKSKCGLSWSVLLSTTIRLITVVKMLRNKLSYITKCALCLVIEYVSSITHGQIVDAELANQSARFALAML